MKQFNLPPNDPRIQRMTLEMRNFCIANMNADINEANGRATKGAVSDTTNEDWYHEPDYKFKPIPKGTNVKAMMKNITSILGPQRVYQGMQFVKAQKDQARVRHAYRVHSGQQGEHIAMKGLMQKAKEAKQRGVDKSGTLDQFFSKKDKSNTGNKYGFDI